MLKSAYPKSGTRGTGLLVRPKTRDPFHGLDPGPKTWNSKGGTRD